MKNNKTYIVTVIMHNGKRNSLLLTNSKIKAEQVKADYLDRDAQIRPVGQLEALRIKENNPYIFTYII